MITRSAALKNKSIRAIIDGSECAKTARVKTLVYEKPESGEELSRLTTYRGTVQPHPRLELLFDEEGFQVWADADLAVVRLDEPVKDFPILKLPASEIRPGDPIIMTGYGPGDTDEDTYGDRHFASNTASWIRKLDTGSVEFVAVSHRQAEGSLTSHLLGGDSGGACLSKTDENVLVGIAASNARNRKGEILSIFTSVYAHRAWLAQQLSGL